MLGSAKGIFVTGIDTEVGKTVVAGGLMQALGERGRYWKPVQTGTLIADDTEEIARLTGLGSECFYSPLARFPEPVSPHLAASRWNKALPLSLFKEAFSRFEGFTVVEGAGGVLTPVTEEMLFRDLIHALELDVLVVARDRLGAINQTLQTLEALKGVRVRGVVWTEHQGQLGNREAVEKWSGAPTLACLPPNLDARGRLHDAAQASGLRALLDLPTAPEI